MYSSFGTSGWHGLEHECVFMKIKMLIEITFIAILLIISMYNFGTFRQHGLKLEFFEAKIKIISEIHFIIIVLFQCAILELNVSTV
jgi:hypothetical protein